MMHSPLSLKYFINRSIVLHLYRQYLRTLKPLHRDLKSELHLRVRHEFETSRHVTESSVIQQLLHEGRKQLKELEIIADSATKGRTEAIRYRQSRMTSIPQSTFHFQKVQKHFSLTSFTTCSQE